MRPQAADQTLSDSSVTCHDHVMTRALLFVASITLFATAPAAAQRFGGDGPVCLQVWKRGGSSTISCQYLSWDACQAEAAGRSATCVLNPYAQPPSEPGRRRPPR
ncbi:DUF3551 domain-containing protein [Bradyrhizobium sp. HKCCYLS2038]|uniref:DUF3551 domain-containing protein n=1 Tax=unclassified Bradyrhizobium TaxID=2631580 RepID=UPI003EBE27AE